ncbi:MAG: hypothetical protein WAV89_11995 [Ignavibacteriaceae bacterium]
MKAKEFVKKNFLPMLLLAIMSFFVGCQDEMSVQSTDQVTTDQEALEKLVAEDSVLTSFEPNYNEEGDMSLSKESAEIYPFRVGQKMRLVSSNLTVDFNGDTAFGLVTNTFEGVLYIRGSYNAEATHGDTSITKAFTSTVTRNVIFIKGKNSTDSTAYWRISAISLPMGGTSSPNINIKKFTAFLSDGDTLEITSPNDYYLLRNWGYWWRWHHIPIVNLGNEVLLRLELNSAYADTDFVTLTFGADRFGSHRLKRKFELISSVQNGNTYDKVYEQTFISHQFPGFYHAIINTMPKQVVYDDSTPVEVESWGIPYFTKF